MKEKLLSLLVGVVITLLGLAGVQAIADAFNETETIELGPVIIVDAPTKAPSAEPTPEPTPEATRNTPPNQPRPRLQPRLQRPSPPRRPSSSRNPRRSTSTTTMTTTTGTMMTTGTTTMEMMTDEAHVGGA